MAALTLLPRVRQGKPSLFLFALALLAGLFSTSTYGQNAGSRDITNIARVDYVVDSGPPQTREADASFTVLPARTPSIITFYKYAPTISGALNLNVGITESRTSEDGPLVALPAPNDFGSPVNLNALVPVIDTGLYTSGQPIFLTLEDLDQNVFPDVRETVFITLTVDVTGDLEVLRLVETGPDTGIFAGYIQSNNNSAVPFDGELELQPDATIMANYVDPIDGTDTSEDAALVDPFGLVFDTETGLPVNGAAVTLINDATGLPAQVFGDDGVSSYPSTVITGETVVDGGGNSYPMPDGGYRFPLLAPGNYRLEIVPPGSYSFPTVESDADIQTLPNAPFTLVTGSRGEVFSVQPGPAIRIDVPIDPDSGPTADTGLFLQKEASEDRVAIGDFLRYDLTLQNSGDASIGNLVLEDRLPFGFRYQKGSAYLDDQKIDNPEISSDGRDLRFTALGTLDAGQSARLRYVVEIQSGARLGRATNTAILSGAGNEVSNEARATVTVEDDLRGENILIGRVMIRPSDRDLWTKDDQTIGLPGLAGARIYLEDGSYVITDKEGRFHFEGIKPGVHVVQLDGLSVPEKYEIVGIENTRFAGRSYSQFVDLQAGAMWRTDFFVVEKEERKGSVTARLSELAEDGFKGVALSVDSELMELSRLRAIFMMPDGVRVEAETVQFGDETIELATRGKTVTADFGELPAGTSGELRVPLTFGDPAELKVILFADFDGEKNIRSEQIAVSLDGTADQSETATISRAVEWEEVQPINEEPEVKKDFETLHDGQWIEDAGPAFEWVEPLADFVPSISAVNVGIKYPEGHRVELYRKGERVSALFLDDTVVGNSGKAKINRWGGLNLDDGENVFEAVLLDKEGNEVERIERSFNFSGLPVSAEYVKEASTLVADGRTNPVIALRLTDAQGNPVRAGVRGRYSVDPPYMALTRTGDDRMNLFLTVGEYERQIEYIVGEGGIALLHLEPTSQAGEVTVRLNLDEREFDFNAWLEAPLRDWILVGLATGTTGYNDISSKVDDFGPGDVEEDYYDDGRVAFFAKGRVKGKWLLTTAYDSDKESEQRGQESLHQVIDPDEYYTLYGDETEQGYEAASAEKLYVKLEREAFYAMFGDFDTGLTVTELSRYTRSMTGVKSEYQGENVSFNGFISETDLAYVRDEIQGDGTSGLYELSRREIVINSEKIRLQTRDRFQSQIIVEERILNRHLDYNINYDDSTIYFKSPVYSRDENLNPIFIIAEYEVEDSGGESYNYGGRAAVHTKDDRLEVGASYIHEEDSEAEGDLYGADLRVQLNEQNELTAEIARTDVEGSAIDSEDSDGNAYLVQLRHLSKAVDGSVYFRQQDEGFGLGQQNSSETGTRKYGMEGTYRIAEEIDAIVNIYREELLGTDSTRNYVEAGVEKQWDADTTIRLGYIWTEDDIEDSGTFTSDQIHTGISRNLFSDKLIFRADHYQSINGNDESSDYPTRTILGMDYYLNERVRLYSEYELTFGEETDTENARVGLATTPWTGASLDSSVTQQIAEDGGRTAANFGLAQRLQLTEHWSFDGGLDSSRNFNGSSGGRNTFNSGTTPASGSTEDFVALSLGSTYTEKTWSFSNRVEQRYADTEDRWSLYGGIIGEVETGLHMALQAQLFETQADDGDDTTNADVRYSIAYRPLDSEWILLNRLDFLFDSLGGDDSVDNLRIVNRGDINYLPHEDLQIAFQYGMKYVMTDISGDDYSGFTDFYGIETRYDIHRRIDIGFRASSRHSWNDHAIDYSVGPSIGVNPAKNMWVSLGYNVAGYNDDEFSDGNYTAQGPYVEFRVKYDQDTLNDLRSLFKHDL